mmetsp:Transcript_36266/g.95617  ORF Transcript_36266/g.95617 Transcript_36266/m.95617 type:complete len:202 (-) Transcript_36266:696-1301(-)
MQIRCRSKYCSEMGSYRYSSYLCRLVSVHLVSQLAYVDCRFGERRGNGKRATTDNNSEFGARDHPECRARGPRSTAARSMLRGLRPGHRSPDTARHPLKDVRRLYQGFRTSHTELDCCSDRQAPSAYERAQPTTTSLPPSVHRARKECQQRSKTAQSMAAGYCKLPAYFRAAASSASLACSPTTFSFTAILPCWSALSCSP